MVKSLSGFVLVLYSVTAPFYLAQAANKTDHYLAVNSINKKKQVLAMPATQQHAQMQPYRAEYNLRASNMPLNAKAIHTFKKLSDGKAQLKTHAQALFSELTETAVLQWQNCDSQALTYDYARQIFNKKLSYQQTFIYQGKQPKQVNYLRDGKSVIIPLNSVVDDRLLSQLKVRCRVKAGSKKFSLNVLDKDQIRTQDFQVEGNDKLKLPIGEISGIKVERLREPLSKRATTVWLAPNWDYIVVKAIQENDDEVVTLELVSLQFL
jgi:hypothetical protein